MFHGNHYELNADCEEVDGWKGFCGRSDAALPGGGRPPAETALMVATAGLYISRP